MNKNQYEVLSEWLNIFQPYACMLTSSVHLTPKLTFDYQEKGQLPSCLPGHTIFVINSSVTALRDLCYFLLQHSSFSNSVQQMCAKTSLQQKRPKADLARMDFPSLLPSSHWRYSGTLLWLLASSYSYNYHGLGKENSQWKFLWKHRITILQKKAKRREISRIF